MMPTSTPVVFRAQKWPRRLLALLAMSLFLWAAPAADAADAADALDQRQEVITSAVSVPGGFVQAQSFTAGLSGRLTRASVHVANPSAAVTLTVQIQTLSETGQPGGSVLAGQSLSLDPGSARWVEVLFEQPALLAEGARYALVLRPSDSFAWSVATTDPYAGGAAWTGMDEWWNERGDYAFRTYVETGDEATVEPVPDPPAVAGGKVKAHGWIQDDDAQNGRGKLAVEGALAADGSPEGKAQYRFRSADGQRYVVRSTQWIALTLAPDGSTASFTAACVVESNAAAERGMARPCTMAVELADGEPDSVSLTITDEAGEIWHVAGSALGGGQVKLRPIP